MFNFFKNLRAKKMSQDEPTIKSEEVKEPKAEIEEVKVLETEEGFIEPKFILKEDVKAMSIPCDHKNYLPQALLKIDKKLLSDTTKVAI